MGRFRKSQSKPASKVKLSSGELKFITDHTSFTEDHIKEWHKGFMEDCPDGRMDREKMKQMFHSIMPKVIPIKFFCLSSCIPVCTFNLVNFTRTIQTKQTLEHLQSSSLTSSLGYLTRMETGQLTSRSL